MLVIFSVPIVASIAFYFLSENSDRAYLSLVCFIVTFVLWFQYLIFVLCFCKSDKLFDFYLKLAGKRDKATGGITDSYKHLREHGNSFAIVLLDMVLALARFSVSKVWPSTGCMADDDLKTIISYVSLIVLWLSPAAGIWIIGTFFERRFIDAK